MQFNAATSKSGKSYFIELDWRTNKSEFQNKNKKITLKTTLKYDDSIYDASLKIPKKLLEEESFSLKESGYDIEICNENVILIINKQKLKRNPTGTYLFLINRYGIDFSINIRKVESFVPDAAFYLNNKEYPRRQLKTKNVYIKVYNGGSCSPR